MGVKGKRPQLFCSSGKVWPSVTYPCKEPVVGHDAHGIRVCKDHGYTGALVVLDAYINWHEEFSNSPRLCVLLNRETRGVRIFERKGRFLYSDLEGVVSFYTTGGPPGGYGGTLFRNWVRQPDGSIIEEEHHNNWSSSAGAMNSAGFGPCVDVDIAYLTKDGLAAMERGYTFMAGAIDLRLAEQAIRCVQGAQLMWVDDVLIPVKLGLMPTRILGKMEPRDRMSSDLSQEQQEVVGFQ